MRRYELVLCRSERQQFTLEALAASAGMHPALVERYVEFGLIEPVAWVGAERLFDASAVPRLRMVERLRCDLGINLSGVTVILDLLDQLRALRRENEGLRSRL
jgi:MerR family transcriptional regulator/heat shock protein HspR